MNTVPRGPASNDRQHNRAWGRDRIMKRNMLALLFALVPGIAGADTFTVNSARANASHIYTGQLAGYYVDYSPAGISWRADGPSQIGTDFIFHSDFDEQFWLWTAAMPPGGGDWQTGSGVCSAAISGSSVTLYCQ